MQNLGKALAAVFERVPGLRTITVSGNDGIPLLKYPESSTVDAAPTSGALESAFAIAADQVCNSMSCPQELGNVDDSSSMTQRCHVH